MDIGEVVKQSGLKPSTLRYYEEKGLIKSVGRNGLRRVFHKSVMDRLALIAMGRNAGFSLDEIGEMFTSEGPRIDREQLLKKADELERQAKQFQALSIGLKHAAACSAPSHFECPKFLRVMEVAMKDQRRRKSGG